MAVLEARFDGVAGGSAGRRRTCSDFVQLAAPNKSDEFIALGMREPNGIYILTDCHTLVGNLDLRTFVAVLA